MTRFRRREFKALVRMQQQAKTWRLNAQSKKEPAAAEQPSAGNSADAAPTISPPELRKSLSKRLSEPSLANPAKPLAASAPVLPPPAPPAEERSEECADEGAQFSDDEVTILHSMLDLKQKTVCNRRVTTV